MFLVRILRIATLAAMAATLVVGLFRPEFFGALRAVLVWLIPVWIGTLFLAQTLTHRRPDGSTIVQVWWDRLRGKRWACEACGRRYSPDVPLCVDCGLVRPEASWVCEVCETENEPAAEKCVRCTVPRP